MKWWRWALLVPVCLLAYLSVVAVWASVSFDDAVARLPAFEAAPLSPRQAAVLAQIEDPAFFQHHGLSLAPGQGLATISSSLARTLYLSDGNLDGVEGAFQRLYRGVFNCCKKVDVGRDVMALVVDARLGKERQLALYAASVYMGTQQGGQIHGLAQASRSYLGKPLAQASEQEFVGLVAMIKAPNQYHPVQHPQEHALRSARLAAVLAGKCHPEGWFDTTYRHCTP